MTCETVATKLDEYVDGDLTESEFQEIELHLAGCDECRGEERAVRALLAQAAALPREIAPSRDLWPDVAERLRGAAGARLVSASSRPRSFRPMTFAAAAAVALIAISAARWMRDRGPATPDVAPRVQAVAATTAPVELLDSERDYARATGELMAAIDRQKGTLSPETRAVLDANLKTIDDALAQVRTALRKDPGNAQLTHLLTSTHQKKVDALQRVVRLNRT
jgi:anti-sigma-K factor RskA